MEEDIYLEYERKGDTVEARNLREIL